MTDETKLDFTVEELKTIPELKLISYFEEVEHLAKDIEKLTGIYYLIPIIQSAHESRNGNSGLARNHCNLFGIVATDSWKKANGTVALMPTFEFIEGKRVDMNREFRAYPSWRSNFEDWAKIITTLKVYKKAYALMKAKETAVEGIKEMGKVYATDPSYAQNLIEIYKSLSI